MKRPRRIRDSRRLHAIRSLYNLEAEAQLVSELVGLLNEAIRNARYWHDAEHEARERRKR